MLISEAFAETAASAGQSDASLLSLLPMFGIVILFYFLLIRPQSKRAKEHKQMTEGLQRGDEVITNGGFLGMIISVSESYVIVEIAPNVEVTVAKSSIQTLLPKGTLKNIDPKGGKTQKLKPTKMESENEASDSKSNDADKS